MKRFFLLFLILVSTSGCAALGFGSSGGERYQTWARANDALAREDFAGAEALFEQVATNYPDSVEGRESLFFLGALRLDPRNDEWDPQPAEERLASYLALADEQRKQLYRYLEAQTLHELARQLNLPPESRVAGLQPEERVVTVEERVVVPARESRELSAEVARLRQQLAERDARIRTQQEELERIRRTLTPRQ